MSRIGIGANVTQPDAKCMSCKYWKQAEKERFGFGRGGYCSTGYCKKDFRKKGDIPYEQAVVARLDRTVVAYPLNDLGSSDYIQLADYSTEEKAIKAMEMCRNRYACCKTRNNGMNSLTMAMSFRRTDEIEQLLETFAEENIFQFPADEDVE